MKRLLIGLLTVICFNFVIQIVQPIWQDSQIVQAISRSNAVKTMDIKGKTANSKELNIQIALTTIGAIMLAGSILSAAIYDRIHQRCGRKSGVQFWCDKRKGWSVDQCEESTLVYVCMTIFAFGLTILLIGILGIFAYH